MKKFEEALNYFLEIISKEDVEEYSKGVKELNLPVFSLDFMDEIINKATTIFSEEESVVKVKKGQNGDNNENDDNFNVVVVGDLHGHILDLFRIIKDQGAPPSKSYIFLGDLVDRGEFSTELIILVFLMKIMYPKQVFVLRGNHEFAMMSLYNGFSAELAAVYKTESLQTSFFHAFSYLPIGAVFNDNILLLHGGIGPSIKSLSDIEAIKRPVFDFTTNQVLLSVVWNDPEESLTTDFSKSTRGTGFIYGPNALKSFLEQSNLKKLIRAHECINEGYAELFNGSLVTVFSASSYCGSSHNKSGILILKEQDVIEPKVFEPLEYLKRSNVKFIPFTPKVSDPQTNNESEAQNSEAPFAFSTRHIPHKACSNFKQNSNSSGQIKNYLRLPPLARNGTKSYKTDRPFSSTIGIFDKFSPSLKASALKSYTTAIPSPPSTTSSLTPTGLTSSLKHFSSPFGSSIPMSRKRF